MSITIQEVSEENKQHYLCCLEEWSDEMKEGQPAKAEWFEKMQTKGLGVKLAATEEGVVAGMIQYVPIAYSGVEGNDLYFIKCIWVHAYKKGIGDHRGKGFGQALLAAAEEDVKKRGAKGMVAWGMRLPFWMKASWFRKQGYKTVDNDSIAALLWKPFSDDARPPKWIKETPEPELVDDKVTVTGIHNGWCPAKNATIERAKRATLQFDEKAIWNEINTFESEGLEQWGFKDGVYVNDKCISAGPPLTYEKIVKKIEKAVKKLK